MLNTAQQYNVKQEIETVFEECQKHIDEAFMQYQQDVDTAMKELREDLIFSKPSVH